ncbi:MAG: hypothetical protein U5K77_01985 [Candidatus Saccharibacteria bacterium]|nr:hypothetical protein [Candidatus Saccharibacteria bacterium]
MIISDKHKYVFLETPHTGSTAISKELRENYSGEEVLHKHANYHEFLKVASPEQKKYFVFAGLRNPLDEATSVYSKFLFNHKGNYTNNKKELDRGGWVTKRKVEIFKLVASGGSFCQFLEKYYPRTYTSNININKRHVDHVIRFEDINKDFMEVLEKLNIKPLRDLPVVNKTKKEGNFKEYYDYECRGYAIKIFSPFMKEWGYELPKGWPNKKVRAWSLGVYSFNKIGRVAYSSHIKTGPLKKLTALRNILE